METLNAALLGIATLIIALILQQLLKPKAVAKKVDTKVFDSMLDDDGWAEEEEGEKPKVAPHAAVPIPESTPMPQPAAAAVPEPPKKVNEGPFNIGDRVILKNLVSAQELNGRHGVIADLWDKKTERYPVDLDLSDHTRKSPLSVKVGNMTKEPPIENDAECSPAKNACLLEAEGRAASFIFSALRGSLQNSLKGEKDPQKLAEFGWKFWKTPDGQGVYPSLKEFLTKGILQQNKLEDLEKQLNAENPKGAYSMVSNAMTSELAVASWHVRVHGAFWIVGIGPEGTLVVPENNTRQVYCVLGFKIPLGSQGQFPRPPKFFLTLLPWYGRIIHDPMLMTTTGGNQVELASPKLAAELVASCKLATSEGRVISRLAQLEVEGGSKEGLPYRPMIRPPQMKMDPPTDQEKSMVESLAAYTIAADKQPTSAWNFIRSGNGNQVLIINGKGAKLGDFLAGGPEPTHLEIFESLLVVCKEKKERPRIVGVDTPSAVTRLQFLTQGVPNMTVAQVNVTRKPQQQQQQQKQGS